MCALCKMEIGAPGHYVLSGDDVIYPLSKSVRCASLDDVIIQLCGGDRHGPHGSPESVASGWDGAQLRVRRLAWLYHDVHLRLRPQAPFLPAKHPTKRPFNHRPTPPR